MPADLQSAFQAAVAGHAQDGRQRVRNWRRPDPGVLRRRTELREKALEVDQRPRAGLDRRRPPPRCRLDFWPVVRYSRSTTANNTYLNDYLLQIDAGGHDTYINAAGSSLVDVNFGPPGQPGLKGEGPAKGCQRTIPGLTAADCVPAAGVLIDLGGNDRYGICQTPDVDAVCTTDPVVRRMMTNGAGFLGVGILLDSSGDDVYTGKTVSNGAGHVGGVGILHDKAGNDSYLEVRNSTGFALVVGLGIFRDYAGNDTHDFYMPIKLAGASGVNQTPGAGGVIDDEAACDNLPRYDVGGGNVGGVGVAVDDAGDGDDTYLGGFAPAFLAPFGSNAGGGSSQGFANNQAAGSLVDRAGIDSYSIVTLSLSSGGTWLRTPHPNGRGNGVTLVPEIDPATQQGGQTGTGRRLQRLLTAGLDGKEGGGHPQGESVAALGRVRPRGRARDTGR